MAEYSDGSMVVDTEIDTTGFARDSKKLKTAVKSLSGQFGRMAQQVKVAVARNNADAVQSLTEKFIQSQAQVEALRKKLEAFSRVKILSDKYKETRDDIDKTSDALQKLMDKQKKLQAMGADKTSDKWDGIQEKIKTAETEIAEYESKLKQVQAQIDWRQQAITTGRGDDGQLLEPAALFNLADDLRVRQKKAEELKAKLAELRAEYAQLTEAAATADPGSKQWQSNQYDIEQTKKKLEELEATRERMESEGTAYKMGGETEEYRQLAEEMENAGREADSLKAKLEASKGSSSNLGNIYITLAKALGRAALGLAQVARRAAQAAANLAKMAGSGIINGLKKLGAGIKTAATGLVSLLRGSKKTNAGFQLNLKTILRYGLGIRSLFVLFNRLRSAVKDALGTMAKIDGPTNKALSSIVTALNRLKNSLGTAFQPIVTAVAPYLTQFMNMLSDAITKIGEFFAALTGQKYVLRATAKQTDYAKSLDKTTKSAKEAKRQLAGFDELNILSDSSKSSSADDAAGQFEKIPVATAITDFLKRIKEAIQNGDYAQIGRMLAEKLNDVFARVDRLISWENIGGTVSRYVDTICGTINGLVYGVNWDLIGHTFGSGINTVVNTLNRLLTGIDWEAIGSSIAQGFNGLVKRVNWANLGAVFGNKLNAIFDALYGFARDFKWGDAGTAFANAVYGLINTVSWSRLGRSLGTLLNGAIAFMRNAANTFKWEATGEKFAEAVNTLKNTVNWFTLGETLRKLLGGAIALMKTAVLKIEWGDAGTKFGEALNGFFADTTLWSDAGTTIDGMLKGLVDFGQRALDVFKPTQVATDLKALFKSVDWSGIASATWQLIKTAFQKTGSFLTALFGDDGSNPYGDSAVSAQAQRYEQMLTRNFDPSKSGLGYSIGKQLSDLIGSIDWKQFGATLSEAATKLFTELAGFFKAIADEGKLTQAVTDFFDGIDWQAVTDSMLNAAKEFFRMLGKSFLDWTLDGFFRPFEADFEKGAQNAEQVVQNRVEQTGATVASSMILYGESAGNSYYSGLVAAISDTDGVEAEYKSAWDEIMSAADNNGDGMTAAEQFYSGFKNKVLNDKGQIKEEFRGNMEDIFFPAELEALERGELTLDQFFDGFYNGTINGKGEATQTLKDAFEAIVGKTEKDTLEIGSPSKRAEKDAKFFLEGFSKGIDGGEKTTTSAVKTAFTTITDVAFAMIAMNLAVSVGMAAVKSTFETKLGEIETTTKTAFSNLKTNASTALAEMRTTATQGVTQIVTTVRTQMQTIQQQVQTTFTAISSAIMSRTQAANQTVSSGFHAIGQTITGNMQSAMRTVDSMNWDSVGVGVTNGLRAGLHNGWPNLRTDLANMARAMVQQVKNSLGIHSPSRVFRDEVGAMLGLGTAEGLEDSQPQILNTVSRVAGAISEEMRNADTSTILSDGGSGIVNGLDGVLSTFADKVSDSFTSLIDRLNDIAASVTFRAPAVADGAVMPYSVSAKSGDAPGALTGALVEANDDLSSVVIQATTNATAAIVRAIEEYSGTTINLDKRSLTDAVVDEINRRTRAQGASPLLI